MIKMLDNKWLSIQEAAKLIGCTPSYVRLLARNNTIKSHKLNERAWLIDAIDAVKYATKPAGPGRPRSSKKT